MVSTQQHDDHPDIQHFLDWRNSEEASCTGTGGSNNESAPRYIPLETLKEYFDGRDRLNRLLRAVFSDGGAPTATEIRENYIRPFAILLCLGQGALIKFFTNRENLQDKKLPFQTKPQHFPSSSNIELWAAFSTQQWEFYPTMLSYLSHRELDENEILPLRFLEVIGRGGTSSVRKVEVHPHYNKMLPNHMEYEVTYLCFRMLCNLVLRSSLSAEGRAFCGKDLQRQRC